MIENFVRIHVPDCSFDPSLIQWNVIALPHIFRFRLEDKEILILYKNCTGKILIVHFNCINTFMIRSTSLAENHQDFICKL